MVRPRVTQRWVEEPDLPDSSPPEEGRAGLGSKAHTHCLPPKAKESCLCRRLSPAPAAAVALSEFERFQICLHLG